MTHFRLVLPHQLYEEHLAAPADTVFVFVEHDLLFRQYSFHAQKLVLHRASMDRFARRLRSEGWEVLALRSHATRPSHEQLSALVREHAPERVTWFDVVDDWLERDVRAALEAGGYRMSEADLLESPNFLTSREEIDVWFAENDARMHDFYVWQRRRLDLLIDPDGEPTGGRWSFDADNRKKLPRRYVPPRIRQFAGRALVRREGEFDIDALLAGHDLETPAADPAVARAIAWVQREFPDNPGDPTEFTWPTDAAEAREHLAEFVRDRLHDFGPYEDAISAEHPFINHSLLTAALNIGLLHPAQVVRAVLDAADERTPTASLEGFLRQVIGWREYMRATYRVQGRQLRTANALRHANTLGEGWWDGTTGLAPVDLVIQRVLATGYAHHIERLMVLGNAMSLLRVHPDEVYRWFMEMFIDAYDWVMVPNVYAMSQFAAGEAITTKPYVSGSNYLRQMSDLPKGEWQGDWDALYWAFVDDHRAVFEQNPRARMVVSLLDRLAPETRDAHRARADSLIVHRNGGSSLLRAPDGS